MLSTCPSETSFSSFRAANVVIVMTGRDRLSPRSRFLGTLRLAKVAPGGRSLGSRLDGSLQVPHTGVAAATFLENDKNSSNEKEQQVHFFWGMKRPKTRLPVSAAEIHLEQPVHIGLGDIAQLFAKSGLNRTPFHTVGFGEHLVKQVPMLEAPRRRNTLDVPFFFVVK